MHQTSQNISCCDRENYSKLDKMENCNDTLDEDEWEELEYNIHDATPFSSLNSYASGIKLNSERYEKASSDANTSKSAEESSSWKTSESVAMSMNKAVSSLLPSDVIRPYCIVLNQKHTRIGVGHEFGFLVFTVNKSALNTSCNPHNRNMQQGRKESIDDNFADNCMRGVETYLSLDPLYNMSIREYNSLKRQIQHARSSQSRTTFDNDNLNKDVDRPEETTATKKETSTDKVGNIRISSNNVKSRQEENTVKNVDHETENASNACSGADNVDDFDNNDDDDMLGMLLSYSRRRELKRQSVEFSCKLQMSSEASFCVANIVDEQSPSLHYKERKQVDTKSFRGQDNCNVPEIVQETEQKHLESTELQISEETEDVELKQQKMEVHEWQEEEEGSVGFAGGGVTAMALLYEQHCVAIVKTRKCESKQQPQNECKEEESYEHKNEEVLPDSRCVQLIQEGENFHTITLDQMQNTCDIIDKIELDAHLLFVCTTTMLLIYTNPLEPEWSACAFTITLNCNSPSTVGKFATTPLPVTHNRNITSRKYVDFERSTSELESTADLVNNSTKVFPVLPSWLTAQECVREPYPFVLDYVNKLFLLPSADAPNGFTLWQYSTHCVLHTLQESVKTNNNDKTFIGVDGREECEEQLLWQQTDSFNNFLNTYQSCTIFGGKVNLIVEEVASTANAHRNCLASLALCKVQPADTSTWMAYISAVTANECKSPHQQEQTQEYVENSKENGVLLVAACSNYTTRITLWGLRYVDDRSSIINTRSFTLSDTMTMQSQLAVHHAIESANKLNVEKKKSCFVLLREFRVGFRFPPSARSHLPLGRNSRATRHNYVENKHNTNTVYNSVSNNSNDGVRSVNCPNHTRANEEESTTTSSSSKQHKEHFSNLFSCPLTHVQFLSHGHYIFCVQGTKLLLFATSPYNDKNIAQKINNNNNYNNNSDNVKFYKELKQQQQRQQQEQQDVCTVRKQVDYNRYSMLAKLNKYIPSIFHLESYTKQAWSSCEGKLPVHDVNFYPKWLLLEVQDKKARESLQQQCTRNNTAMDEHEASFHLSPIVNLSNDDLNNDLNSKKESTTYLTTRLSSTLQSTLAKWCHVKNIISSMHINQNDNYNINNIYTSKQFTDYITTTTSTSTNNNNISNINDNSLIIKRESSNCQSSCEKGVGMRYDSFHTSCIPSFQTFLTPSLPESSLEYSTDYENKFANSVNEAKVEIKNVQIISILENDQQKEEDDSSNRNIINTSKADRRNKTKIMQHTKHLCKTLAECLLIWESTDEANQWTPYNRLGLLRLHCATCDGSHLTILLNKQTGTFTCTPATCFTFA